jgi:hypothetical protein
VFPQKGSFSAVAGRPTRRSFLLLLALVGLGVSVVAGFAQPRSDSREALKNLHRELREEVRGRSYGACSELIEAPLKELDSSTR